MNLEHGAPFIERDQPGQGQERYPCVEVDNDEDVLTDVVRPKVVEVVDVVGEEITAGGVSPSVQREQGVLSDTEGEATVVKGFREVRSPSSLRTREESMPQHDVHGDDVVLPYLFDVRSEDLEEIPDEQTNEAAPVFDLRVPAVRNKLRSLAARVYPRDVSSVALEQLANDDSPEAVDFLRWYTVNRTFNPRAQECYKQAVARLDDRSDIDSPNYLRQLADVQGQMEQADDIKTMLGLSLAMRDVYEYKQQIATEKRRRLLDPTWRASHERRIKEDLVHAQTGETKLPAEQTLVEQNHQAVTSDIPTFKERLTAKAEREKAERDLLAHEEQLRLQAKTEQEQRALVMKDLSVLLGYTNEDKDRFEAYVQEVQQQLASQNELGLWDKLQEATGVYASALRHDDQLPTWRRFINRTGRVFGFSTKLSRGKSEFEDVRAQVDDILAASHHAGPEVEQQEVALLHQRAVAREKRQKRRSFIDRVLTRGKQD